MSAGAGDIPDPGPRQRYSARAFPAYRFVPGLHPHPTRDPRGHSYVARRAPDRRRAWDPAEWRELEDWLYGIDLFNAHFFWEAHEAWEGLWAARDRASTAAQFIQGLIQISAALLKIHMHSAAGAHVLSGEGLAKLRQVAATNPCLMGVDLGPAITALELYFAPVALGLLPALDQVPLLRPK